MSSAYLELLKQENVPALGCTEPMAAAFASALSIQALGVPCEELHIEASANILKNAMGVGIPKSAQVGLSVACALAWAGGKPEYGLEVLRDVSEDDRRRALSFLQEDKVTVTLADTDELLYIRASCCGRGHSASAVIQNNHTNVTLLERDGIALSTSFFSSQPGLDTCLSEKPVFSLKEIWAFATCASKEDLSFLQQGIHMNEQIAYIGMQGEYGLGTGRILREQWLHGGAQDAGLYAASLAAAAADARMSGCDLPVMSVAGSGNQGIATILPPYALSQLLGKDSTTTLRAIALCQLVALQAKQYSGRLSALCGAANAAALGIAAAAVYLYGGDYPAACCAIRSVAGDLSGLICDGAKSSCALKLATSIQTALLCAHMALRGVGVAGTDGIVDDNPDQTLVNLGILAQKGMKITDQVILEIMLSKSAS